MLTEQSKLLFLILGITLISGLGDALGFIHAARMWRDDRIVWGELGKSALGFAVGLGSFWLSVKYLAEFGVMAPEAQTLIWFGATIVGVALISGRFLQWQPTEQVVAGAVVLGVGWLLLRADT
jgi:hypothetical protein